jgi:uncharacterized protein YbaP (TraB family)
MSHLWRNLVLIIAVALPSGCSVHRMAEKTRLPRHPIHEARMTNQPAPGYVLTGVWRVRGASNTVYLAGTSHLVADDEIPFPSAYYAAYVDAQEIYVEADPLSFSGTWLVLSALPGAVKFFLSNSSEFICPKGRSLEDYLSPETVRLLRQHYGKQYEVKRGFTPLGLVFFAEFESSQGGGEGGVDDLFALLAHRDGKRIRSLDDRTAVQVMVPVLDVMLKQAQSEITARGADAVVKEAILEHQDERDDWRHGDTSAAAKEVAELKRDAPEVYEQLLPGRNRRWFPTIQRALQGRRNVMVLVGALHLAGEQGLIEMLRQEGFKPEQMYGIDRPERAATPARTGK